VRECFAASVDTEIVTKNIDSFTDLVKIIKNAADATLPRMKKRKKATCLWKEDNDIAHIRERILDLRATDSFELQEQRQNIKQLYLRKLEESISTQIAELNSLHEKSRSIAVWRAINNITERKKREKIRIQADTDQEKSEILREHFHKLLNNPSTVPPILSPRNFHLKKPIFNTGEITMKELIAAAKLTAGLKAPGPDGIPGIVYKASTLQHLLPIMNAILAGNISPPTEWTEAIIIPIPKKGDLTKPNNYRGISLMSTAAKLFNKVLLMRLAPLDDVLLPVQSGFRRARGTPEQVLAIRLLIDRCRSRQQTCTIVYVDFTKAFDSVNRCAMKEILELYGIPTKLVNAIMSLYHNTRSRVRLNQDTISEEFYTTTGVLHISLRNCHRLYSERCFPHERAFI
jgi:hypothetical protein